MIKTKKEKILEIGARFQKGDVVITLVNIKNQEAIFHRAFKGTRRLFEQANINHVLRCPSIYKRIEV